MKTLITPLLLGTLTFSLLCFSAGEAHARLPKPIQIHATVVFVDHETQSIVVKPGKGLKPFVLEWNKDTVFTGNGETVTSGALNQGASTLLHYKRVSFRHPILKKVIWADKSDAK